jgi:uncharacterized membrane protein
MTLQTANWIALALNGGSLVLNLWTAWRYWRARRVLETALRMIESADVLVRRPPDDE